MRFLIVPFAMFIMSFVILRTSNRWSTVKNWKRIGIEAAVSLAATLVTVTAIGFIVTFFN